MILQNSLFYYLCEEQNGLKSFLMEPFHFCATVMSGDFSKYVTLIAMVKEKMRSKNMHKRNNAPA